MVSAFMTLTKVRITDKVMAQNGYSGRKSVQMAEIVLEGIKTPLESGDDVLVSGFAKFCAQNKRPRKAPNPVTGEVLILDSREVVTVRCSGKLREQINEKG